MKYIFHGRVIPERTHVHLTGLDEIEILQPDTGLTFKLRVSIVLSVISATVTVEGRISDLLSLRNFLSDSISLFVDTIGFENGCGYEVQIDSCTFEAGKKFVVFGVNINELKDQSRWETTINVIRAHQVASELQKQQLQRSLAEFRRGIRVSQDTGFHAYRSIEAIKLAFNDSWDDMNRNLKVNRTYTDSLRENHANPQRHGGYTFMTSDDRTGMLIKAKTIISRFISYLLNGSRELDVSNFPELL